MPSSRHYKQVRLSFARLNSCTIMLLLNIVYPPWLNANPNSLDSRDISSSEVCRTGVLHLRSRHVIPFMHDSLEAEKSRSATRWHFPHFTRHLPFIPALTSRRASYSYRPYGFCLDKNSPETVGEKKKICTINTHATKPQIGLTLLQNQSVRSESEPDSLSLSRVHKKSLLHE